MTGNVPMSYKINVVFDIDNKTGCSGRAIGNINLGYLFFFFIGVPNPVIPGWVRRAPPFLGGA